MATRRRQRDRRAATNARDTHRFSMMSGATFTFVGFGVLVALLVAARHSTLWRQYVVLVASIVFVVSLAPSPWALVPLLGFLVVGFAAMRVASTHRGRAFSLLIAVILLLFFWLKRYTIIPSRFWIHHPYLTIGLSYILFRLLHLIIESRNEPSLARLPVRNYLSYLIGFNTFVAGPILFYDEYLAEQEAMSRGATLDDVGVGAERIVVGLFKANVLATLLATTRASALSTFHAGGSTATQILAGVGVFALYPLFLYCNFAGYIDIVIGLSRLMGQRLPENFDRPFSAASFIEFWNRWHITLSRWLKTYVFNPLLIALLRQFPSRPLEPLWAISAFFVTFSLVGVWHGQTTSFLFFGFLQGLGVSANKLHQVAMAAMLGKKPYAELARKPLYRMVARGLNYTWFAFTLTWFWGTWSVALNLWSALGRKRTVAVWLVIMIGSSCLLALWELLYARWQTVTLPSASSLAYVRNRTVWLTTLLVVVAVVVFLSSHSAPEVVYKDF